MLQGAERIPVLPFILFAQIIDVKYALITAPLDSGYITKPTSSHV